MRRRWVLIALLVLASSPVAADPTPADKSRAAELAAQSGEHYRHGEYEIAVALLRQAYTLYPQPNLLYNLGRSLEKLGDVPGAIEAYEQYLTTGGDIRDRDAITERVRALRAKVPPPSEATAAPTPPTAPVEPVAPPPNPVMETPIPPATTSPQRDTTEQGPSALPWVVLGAGVATLGVGGAFGYLSNSRHNSAVSESVGTAALSLQHDAQVDAEAANVMFIAGGAVALAGAIWELVDRHHEHRVTASLSPHGAVFVAHW